MKRTEKGKGTNSIFMAMSVYISIFIAMYRVQCEYQRVKTGK